MSKKASATDWSSTAIVLITTRMLLRNLLRSAYNHASFLRWSWFLYQYLRPFVQPTRWLSLKQRRFWLWQQSTIPRRFGPQAHWRKAPAVWPEVDYWVLPGPSGDGSAHVRAIQQLIYPPHLLHISLSSHTESHASLLDGMGLGSLRIPPSFPAPSSSSAQAFWGPGRADWCLICPSDCTPSPTALQLAISAAMADPSTACWQLGKTELGSNLYHDPVTLETLTPSESCILVRRSAMHPNNQRSPHPVLPTSVSALTQQLLATRHTVRHLPWARCTLQKQGEMSNDNVQRPPMSEALACPTSPKTDEAPLVSVIMRTYSGRGSLLRQAMQTVFNQSYPHIELLVVQDGGDDLSCLVHSLAKSAPHILVSFWSQDRLGRSAAGNLGLQQALGQLVMFLDDDDLLLGEHIEALATPLIRDPCLSACYSKSIEIFTAYSAGFENYQEIAHRTYPGQPQAWDYDGLLQRNFIPIQSILFRHSLYAQLGGFDTRLDQLEDWNLWLRYGHQKSFAFIPQITSLFRTPANLRTRAKRQSSLRSAQSFARKNLNRPPV